MLKTAALLPAIEIDMKEILLTQNKVALVDDEDYAELSKHKWYALKANKYQKETFLAVRDDVSNGRANKTKVYMHRQITSAPKGLLVDHRDGNTLNNCRRNLRIATPLQNQGNKGVQTNNKTGFKGVMSLSEGRFTAYITTENRRHKTIGHYSTAEDAAQAYDAEAIQKFGEFAYLNFPNE